MTRPPPEPAPPLVHIHAQPTWRKAAVPYTTEAAREKHDPAIWPWNRTPKRPRGGPA